MTQIPESQIINALHDGLSRDVTGKPPSENSTQDYIDGIKREGISLRDASAVPPHQLLLALYLLRTTDPKRRGDELFRLVLETMLRGQVSSWDQ